MNKEKIVINPKKRITIEKSNDNDNYEFLLDTSGLNKRQKQRYISDFITSSLLLYDFYFMMMESLSDNLSDLGCDTQLNFRWRQFRKG